MIMIRYIISRPPLTAQSIWKTGQHQQHHSSIHKIINIIKHIRNYYQFSSLTSTLLKHIMNYKAFVIWTPQEHPRALRSFFREPTLYIQTPDQPAKRPLCYAILLMGFIYGIESKYAGKCAENLSASMKGEAEVCTSIPMGLFGLR